MPRSAMRCSGSCPISSTDNEQWINPDFGSPDLRTHYDNIRQMVKEKTGQLFSAIVHKLRMEAACQLLKDGRVPVKEVAYQVGYSSAEQFSRTFRACYAVSPREYRRRMLI